MMAFEIPMVVTARRQPRAFAAGDLDAYAAMQANPEVMRYRSPAARGCGHFP